LVLQAKRSDLEIKKEKEGKKEGRKEGRKEELNY
jgi:hypothetical protein